MTETIVTETTLHIVVSHKTLDEMALQYKFDKSQKKLPAELLAPENSQLWPAVLYGISAGSG